IAVRYARALFELVSDDSLEAVNDTLAHLAQAWRESVELRHALLNPAIALDERIAVLRELISSAPKADLLGDFLAVLLVNGRMSAIEAVQRSFASQLAAKKNMLALTITSAFPILEQERSAILEKVQQECGGLVAIEWFV